MSTFLGTITGTILGAIMIATTYFIQSFIGELALFLPLIVLIGLLVLLSRDF